MGNIYEMLLAFAICIIGLFLRKFVKIIEKQLNVENSAKTEALINSIIEESVRSVEENSRMLSEKEKPSGVDKKGNALRIAGILLDAAGIKLPLSVVSEKINATVSRVFH